MDESNAHLDAETLYLFADDALADDETARVQRHLAVCGSCRAEAEMARSFAQESRQPIGGEVEARMHAAVLSSIGAADEPRAPRRSPRSPRAPRQAMWWLSRGLLAAGLAAAAFGLWQLRPADPQSPPTGVVRSTSSAERWELQVSAIDDGWELRWLDQADAAGYTVIIQSASGRTLWQAESESSSLHIDRAELSGIAENDGGYFVSVRFDRAGSPRSSPAVSLPTRH